MAKYTNHAPGARGINLKDGTTRWVEPGETVELDAGDIKNVHIDFRAPAKGEDDAAPKAAPAAPKPAEKKD